jgi:lipoprotein-releasing system ATP-binding protein
MSEILKLEKINKVYGTEIKTQVLFDIDLSFKEGSFNLIPEKSPVL